MIPLQHRTAFKSGRSESNRHTRAPKARGLPLPYIPMDFPSQNGRTRTATIAARRCQFCCSWPPTRRSSRSPTFCSASSPSGSRTPASGLKGRHPQPLDERAAKWIGRCSNPRLLVFSQVLNHLSYRSEENQRKRPGVVVTPGLEEPCFALGAERHKRNGCAGSEFAG
jgi:hypothetical protein